MFAPISDNISRGSIGSYNPMYSQSAPVTLFFNDISKHEVITAYNTSTATLPNDFEIISDFVSRIVLAALLCVFFLLGILGNILVILAVAFSRRLHETANVFLVNLATADLLTSLFLPVHAATLMHESSRFIPHQFCKFIAASTVTTLACSVITIALIAFSRFHVIHSNRPTKSWTATRNVFKKQNVIIMIIFTWLYPLVLLLILLATKIGEIRYSKQYKVCALHMGDETFDYLSLITVMLVPLPAFIVIMVCYTLILRTVRHDHRKVLKQMSVSMRSTPNTPSEVNLRLLEDELSTPSRRSLMRSRLIRSPSTPLTRTSSSPLPRPRSATLTPPVIRVNPPLQQDQPPSPLSSSKSLSISSTHLSTHPPSPLLCSSPSLSPDASVPASRPPPIRPFSLALPSPRSSRRSFHNASSLRLSATSHSSVRKEDTPDRSSTSLSVLSRHKSESNRTLTVQRLSKAKVRRMRRGQIRITANLCMVVCAYAICVMPIAVAVLVPGSQVVIPWLSILLVFPCCLNPVIYAFKHPNFRGVFGNILQCNLKDIPEPAQLLRTMSTASRSSRH